MDTTNRNADNPAQEPDKEPEDRLAKAGEGECSDRDLIISRVVDGHAGAREWSTIESLAATDASIWREIAMAQRDQRALEVLVSSAGSIAEATGLPRASEAEPAHVEIPRRRTGSWAGWAAAAAILLAYITGVPLNGLKLNTPGSSGTTGPVTAGPSFQSADEALANYLTTGKKEGSVLGEIPDKLLVEATPVNSGGYRVITIRQILEVHQVDNLLHFPTSKDEQGNIVTQPVPVTIRSSQPY